MIVTTIALSLLILCAFMLGYYTALCRISKAMQKTLDNTSSVDGDFDRGVCWAIEYIIDNI